MIASTVPAVVLFVGIVPGAMLAVAYRNIARVVVFRSNVAPTKLSWVGVKFWLTDDVVV